MATTYADQAGSISFEALAGPASEVRKKLRTADDEQVIAFTLEHGNARFAETLAEAVKLIAPLILVTLERRERQTLDKLIDALVPQLPLPQHLLVEARMNAEARTAVFETADWLTAAQVSELAGFRSQNPSTQPNKWKREGRVFAVNRNGTDYYPSYALDAERGYRPAEGLEPILRLFRGRMDEWDIAIWFGSLNSFLGGEMPKDLLQREPERVLAAAEDEVIGIQHG